MLHLLPPDRFEQVRHLFRPLHYHLAIFSLIEGHSPGLIAVDDCDDPSIAFAWDQVEGGYYLAGDANDPDFNRALNRFILDEFTPQALAGIGGRDLVLNYAPESWETQAEVILNGLNPLRHTRKHFYLERLAIPNWRERLPESFAMLPVDRKLLARTELCNLERVSRWVHDSWQSVDNFLARGTGSCLIHNDDVVSWSLADYAAGPEIEIGIQTDSRCRRRGFATLTASATVEQCLSRGFQRVGWHCWSNNVASAATALKVGFCLTTEHPVYHAWYNPMDNWLVRGQFLFERGHFQEAATDFGRAFAMLDSAHPASSSSSRFADEGSRRWYYQRAASARLMIGDYESAAALLKRAMRVGWDSKHLDQLQAEKSLAHLHNTEGWYTLVTKLKASLSDGQ